ncbi:MAG: hypothetical protein HZB70_01050 [Candidatus Berkelbacteria bacterium]|nr:MAG: hypothetical protein HZB70_01050 [Candidatus Berkelbacteria bacterium]QQG52074.1 MAG: hypothetical protein HY845_01945 [Candidatus Berkelbacteria bacterium]
MNNKLKVVVLGLAGVIGSFLFAVTPVLAQAELKINLPPRLIFTPNEFLFNRDKYVFRENPPRLDPNGSISGTQIVRVETVDQDQGTGGDERGEYYRIIVGNIEKNWFGYNPLQKSKKLFANLVPMVERVKAYAPPPATNILLFRRAYPFRLTLKQPVSAENIDTLAAYISEKGRKDNAFFGSTTCQEDGSRSFICFKETVIVTNPDTSQITLTLSQKTKLSGIYVQGNIAAPQQIAHLRLAPNAIAVGGSFQDVTGTKLDQYLRDTPTSQIKWDGADGAAAKIDQLYEKRTRGTTIGRSVISGVWYLNTASDNPAEFQTPTSFTSPPDGRLWNVNPANNTFTFNDVDFRGQGTVVINGNAIFNGSVKCSDSKRVGVLVRGNIVFNTTHVECGAYVALGSGAAGFIDIAAEPPADGGTVRGIFVAKGNITIPNAAASPLLIDYDGAFAQQPTVLFKELLTILLIALS